MQASFAVHCMGAETELRRAWRNYSHPPPDHYDPVTAASFELFQKMWAQHIKPGVEQAHNQRLKVADYSGQRRELLEDFIFKALDEITRRLWDRSETNTDLQHAVRELMSQIRGAFGAANVPLPGCILELYVARALGKQSRYCRIGLRAQRHYGVTEEELQRRWS